MADARKGETIHVYTMAEDGRVIDRLGVVTHASRKDNALIVRLEGGQRMSVPFGACNIGKDAMWSRLPRKNVYIELMLDVLVERQDNYRRKMQSVTRKIGVMRSCAGT